MPDELSDLRDEVSAIDREIVALAARRHAVVHRIAGAKARSGSRAPLFDRAREARVLADAALAGADAGLPVGVAERLLRTLIEASHETQEARLRSAEAEGSPHVVPSMLIVGGEGAMGRLLTRTFRDRGSEVSSIDVHDTDPELRARAIGAADIVVISVPMDRATSVAREAAAHVRDDALICDINSLKVDVCAAMEACRGEVLGLHPMFGPTVGSLRRQKVVVCPIREGARAAWLRAELGRMGLELVDSDPETHDRMMAVIQVLVHYTTLVMGDALRASGISVSESLRYTSPIYRLELAVVGRLFTQDPDLYAEIIMENPHAEAMLRHFLDAAAALDGVVRGGDRSAFRDRFRRTATYFEGFAEEAMALSDAIIDVLVERP